MRPLRFLRDSFADMPVSSPAPCRSVFESVRIFAELQESFEPALLETEEHFRQSRIEYLVNLQGRLRKLGFRDNPRMHESDK